MPRKMYDSTSAVDIPRTAQMVAGYTDGLYRWSAQDWAFHAGSRQVRICAVSLDVTAHVADIESGALTMAQGIAWAKLKIARHEVPCFYLSAGRLPELYAALKAAGLPVYSGHTVWVALWNGKFEQESGTVAHQYAGSATSGGHYDLSWVADYWPGVDPAPVAAVTYTYTAMAGAVKIAGPSVDLAEVESIARKWQQAHRGSAVNVLRNGVQFEQLAAAPADAPATAPPPVTPPPIVPAPAPPIDQTRTAWAYLAAFFTETLPAAWVELRHLLGITKSI